MNLKDAMSRLKQQALEFSVKAQKSAEVAAADRAAAAAELDRVNAELAASKGQVQCRASLGELGMHWRGGRALGWASVQQGICRFFLWSVPLSPCSSGRASHAGFGRPH